MADLFQMPRVTYHVFCLAEDQVGVVSLRGIETFTLYSYANLRRDCEDLVRRFTDYVTVKGLDGFLNERQAARAGAWQ